MRLVSWPVHGVGFGSKKLRPAWQCLHGIVAKLHDLRSRRDAVWQQLHVSPRSAPSANARLRTYDRWFRFFNRQFRTLTVSHTAML